VLTTRYGAEALSLAEKRMHALHGQGDLDGAVVWLAVDPRGRLKRDCAWRRPRLSADLCEILG
jgi:hypothetical protein